MKKITSFLFLIWLYAANVSAQYSVLIQFGSAQGAWPDENLTISGTTMYGTTTEGGSHGDGIVFSVSTNGSNYQVLHQFNGADGNYPVSTLTLSGNTLYGTTLNGGTNDSGLIFSVHTDGTGYRILTQFSHINASYPYGKLVLSGNKLFGMAQYGGTNNCGSVFSVDTDGNGFKNILSFTYFIDPTPVSGSLILSGTTLFGMTFYGGTYHYGNIFSVDTSGTNYTDLHDFSGIYNDQYPIGSLTLNGNILYGMTSAILCTGTYGNIFSIKTDGSGYKNIHTFWTGNVWNPYGDVSLLRNKLYGMCSGGGAYGQGGIFSIDTTGANFRNLVNFNGTNGASATSSLTLSGGLFYGMTNSGGISNIGLIFSLDTNSLSAVNSLNEPNGKTLIFPNPSNGTFTVQIKSEESDKNNIVVVYDMLGEKVYSGKLISDETEINLRNEPSGIYLYRVVSEEGNLLGEGKIIIE